MKQNLTYNMNKIWLSVHPIFHVIEFVCANVYQRYNMSMICPRDMKSKTNWHQLMEHQPFTHLCWHYNKLFHDFKIFYTIIKEKVETILTILIVQNTFLCSLLKKFFKIMRDYSPARYHTTKFFYLNHSNILL